MTFAKALTTYVRTVHGGYKQVDILLYQKPGTANILPCI